MSDNNAMVPFNAHGISIQTVDGQTLNFTPAGWRDPFGGDPTAPSVADFLRGSSGKPLPRLSAVQPKDERLDTQEIRKEWAGQFMLIIPEMAVNEKGEAERVKTYVGPLGESISGRVVGYTLNRSYMPKYDSNNTEPLCRSEDFIHPDARYMGKFSTACVNLNPQRGRLDPVCLHARWGKKDPSSGKSEAPDCNDMYVVCLAIKWADLPDVGIETEDEWLYAEASFKSKSAKSGLTLVQQLRAIEYNGRPLYNFPIALTMIDAGIGNAFTGRLLIPQRGHEAEAYPVETEIEPLEAGVLLWQEALQARKERAARLDDDEGQDEQPSAAEVMEGEQPAQIAAPAPAANGNGKKSGKKAMI